MFLFLGLLVVVCFVLFCFVCVCVFFLGFWVVLGIHTHQLGLYGKNELRSDSWWVLRELICLFGCFGAAGMRRDIQALAEEEEEEGAGNRRFVVLWWGRQKGGSFFVGGIERRRRRRRRRSGYSSSSSSAAED